MDCWRLHHLADEVRVVVVRTSEGGVAAVYLASIVFICYLYTMDIPGPHGNCDLDEVEVGLMQTVTSTRMWRVEVRVM